MKPLEIGPEMYLFVELEMNFPCSTVVEAAAGLALLTDCGISLQLWTGGGPSMVNGTMAAFGLKDVSAVLAWCVDFNVIQ